MQLLMLDHDPERAAAGVLQRDLWDQFVRATAALADAWHVLYSNWSAPLDALHPHELVSRAVSDPLMPRTSQIQGKVRFADGLLKPGDKDRWLLAGQRIPALSAARNVPAAEWARELGGNYDWLWRYAAALDRLLYSDNLWLRRAYWTLEMIPPPLVGTSGDWSEMPYTGPSWLMVRADGFVDAVPSFRQAYAHERYVLQGGPGPEDRGRPEPDWLVSTLIDLGQLAAESAD